MRHPGVAMAAVIPAEDGGLDKPKAFVVPREEMRASLTSDDISNGFRAELQGYVKSRLSKHKYPRWVVLVGDLPKNDRGKVDRKVLLERERQGKNRWE